MSPRSRDRVHAQDNADATQMERAVALAQKKNGHASAGTHHNLKSKVSFLSLSNNQIVARASKLGVSLGVYVDQVASSVQKIKSIEIDHRITYLKNNLVNDVHLDTNSLVICRAVNLS
jgi:hypothetical protein